MSRSTLGFRFTIPERRRIWLILRHEVEIFRGGKFLIACSSWMRVCFLVEKLDLRLEDGALMEAKDDG